GDVPQKHWLHQGVLSITTSCGSSIIVHMLLIIVLGLLYIPQLVKSQPTELVAAINERPEEMINQFLEQDITPSKDLALVSSSLASVQGALGVAPTFSEARTQSQVSDTP